MNQFNSCIFEGTMTELSCVAYSISFILEISRTTKINGKNVKAITKIPVYANWNVVDMIEKQKPIKKVVGTVVRVVGHMDSFEADNGKLSLCCYAEHVEVKE